MPKGGWRGGGRPSKGDRVAITIRIRREVAEHIKTLAQAQGKTQGELIEEAFQPK